MASPHGEPPAPRAAPAGEGSAPGATSSTQIFGAGRSPLTSTQLFAGAAPGEGRAGARTPVPHTTQVFGAGTAPQPGGPPPPAIPPLNTTQVFGAAPAQGPVGNATQTFGSVPAQRTGAPGQGASAVGHATQVFGAAPAQGPGPVGNATQTFGAVPPQSAGAPGQKTQAFGAQGAATQPFGAAPAQGPVGNTTQAFGAVPAHGGHKPQPSAPGAASPGQTTQAFGAVSAVPQTTQAFGAVSGPGPAVPQTTQVFGAAPAAGQAPSPPAHDAPTPLGRTQAFGAVSSQAPGPIPQTTQVFGAASGPQPTQDAPSGQTRAFGVASPPAEPPGAGRTALFGAQPQATGPQSTGVRLPPEPVGSETLVPFGPGASHAPVSGGPTTASRRAPVELPPELMAASRASSRVSEAEPERQPVKRLLAVLAVVAGLILTGVLAYPAWRDRDTDMPVAAVEDKDRAALLLLRDDPASRDQAIQRLRALNSAHPRYTEAQAELVLALSLRLADLQMQAELLRQQENQLRADLAALETASLSVRERRAPELAETRTRLVARLAELQPALGALRKELAPLVAELAKAPEVEPAPALVARVKARAFHAGVTASPEALALAERLRKVEDAPRTWSILSRAEYALAADSPPASLEEVAGELEGLRREQTSLFRAYILGARLALRLNDPATARSLLDAVIALNPKHDPAKEWLSQIEPATDTP